MILGPCKAGPRPLLFDLGDTLIHFSRQNIMPDFRRGAKCAHDFLCEQDLVPPSIERYMACCKRWFILDLTWTTIRQREIDILDTMAKAHRTLGLPTDRELVLEVVRRAYQPQQAVGEPEPGVHHVLDYFVDRGHPLALVSNTMVPPSIMDGQLEADGLLKYFPVRVYSSEVGVKKPKSKIFRAALRGLNAKPQGCVFVGDKWHLDVRGAKRLGMITVFKARKKPRWTWPWTPDCVISSMHELPAFVDSLGPSPEHPLSAATAASASATP